MPASTAPGLNTPTVAPMSAAPGGGSAPAPGLINNAGSITQDSGTTAAIASYNPAQASASNASVTGYNPDNISVSPNMTVAGQIGNIIASGSPLMQEAMANANQQMNQRGLINSSQAITAGQDALYSAAEPIAAAYAQTYYDAGKTNAAAENTALNQEAGALNSASQQGAQLETSTSQYNAGQENAAHGTSTELLVSVVRLKAQLAATERENARLNAELAVREPSGSGTGRKSKSG